MTVRIDIKNVLFRNAVAWERPDAVAVASAIDTLTRIIIQVARKTDEAAAVSLETVAAAQTGVAAIERALAGMITLQTVLCGISRRAEKIARQAAGIDLIADLLATQAGPGTAEAVERLRKVRDELGDVFLSITADCRQARRETEAADEAGRALREILAAVEDVSRRSQAACEAASRLLDGAGDFARLFAAKALHS